jgi:hypothetical protein
VQLDTGKVVEGVQEEVGILIVAKYQQVNDDHDNHQEFLFPLGFGAFDPLTNEEVRYDAEYKNANVAAARFVVEEQACGKQEGVTQRDAVLD